MRTAFWLLPCMIATGCVAVQETPPANSDRVGMQQGQDECGAASHAGLMGQPVSKVSSRITNRSQRIASATGDITADFSPSRLNIFYDDKSRLVVGIKCG